MINWWKHYDIMKEVDGVNTLYLRRYFIWRSKWFNIFLHYIPMPDIDKDPHTHPWHFVSFLLHGGYDEEVFDDKRNLVKTNKRRAFAFGKRSADTVHQIVSVLPKTWTLIFTNAYDKKKEWGFLTKDGLVNWRKYLNITTNVDMD